MFNAVSARLDVNEFVERGRGCRQGVAGRSGNTSHAQVEYLPVGTGVSGARPSRGRPVTRRAPTRHTGGCGPVSRRMRALELPFPLARCRELVGEEAETSTDEDVALRAAAILAHIYKVFPATRPCLRRAAVAASYHARPRMPVLHSWPRCSSLRCEFGGGTPRGVTFNSQEMGACDMPDQEEGN
mgnify:CR=1 FL=1